jgi:hypothetical protein
MKVLSTLPSASSAESTVNSQKIADAIPKLKESRTKVDDPTAQEHRRKFERLILQLQSFDNPLSLLLPANWGASVDFFFFSSCPWPLVSSVYVLSSPSSTFSFPSLGTPFTAPCLSLISTYSQLCLAALASSPPLGTFAWTVATLDPSHVFAASLPNPADAVVTAYFASCPAHISHLQTAQPQLSHPLRSNIILTTLLLLLASLLPSSSQEFSSPGIRLHSLSRQIQSQITRVAHNAAFGNGSLFCKLPPPPPSVSADSSPLQVPGQVTASFIQPVDVEKNAFTPWNSNIYFFISSSLASVGSCTEVSENLKQQRKNASVECPVDMSVVLRIAAVRIIYSKWLKIGRAHV